MNRITNIVSEEFKKSLEEEILAIEEEIRALGFPTIQCPIEVYRELHDYHKRLMDLYLSLPKMM